jgi:hypothetical protein
MTFQANRTSLGVGTCFCHPVPIPMTGLVFTASHNTFAEKTGAARLTDMVLGFCGHTGIIITGANKTFVNNLNSARVTSNFSGCFVGVIVTGAASITVG